MALAGVMAVVALLGVGGAGCDGNVGDSLPNTGTGGIQRGEQLYVEHCASCHGVDGEGAGGYPSLITPHIAQQSAGKLFVLIKSGTGGAMPAFGTAMDDAMDDAEIMDVIAYLRTMQKVAGHENDTEPGEPSSDNE